MNNTMYYFHRYFGPLYKALVECEKLEEMVTAKNILFGGTSKVQKLMGDNLDKVFVQADWSNSKDPRLEWALDHFDKDKTQLMIFHDSLWGYLEENYRNKSKSYWLPRCAEKNFKVEVLIPAADEVGSDYAANVKKAITRYGINKLVTSSHDTRKNAISKAFNEAPHLSCKVWFIDWDDEKLESTRYFGPLYKALVECEKLEEMVTAKNILFGGTSKVQKLMPILKKTVEDETNRRENVEKELLSMANNTKFNEQEIERLNKEINQLKQRNALLLMTVEDETSRREKIEDELVMVTKTVEDEISRREKVEEELLMLKKTAEDETSRREIVEEELLMVKMTVEEETNQREKVEKELLTLKKTIDEQTCRCKVVGKELLMLEETGHGFTNLCEFGYAELKEATNDFNDEYKIGEGGYGSVYKGVIHCTTVAIKVLNKGSDQGETEFNQEIETLQKVRHPRLVTLIGACRENLAFVYEFLPKGNLEDCLKNAEDKKYLSWGKRIQIASNICSALVFLHHTKPHGIVHGDLKPANILLDSAYTCKLSDFGTCRRLNLTNTTITPNHKTEDPRGTYFYFDPQYLETNTITAQSDVFAFGVVMLQLVTGREPMAIRMLVEGALMEGKLNEVVDAFANWPIEVAEKMARLGLRCIQWSRKDRPDLAKEVWIEIESMEKVVAHYS